MSKRNGFHLSSPITRSVLVVVIVAVGLGIVGCNEQAARIEEKQVQLQVIAKTNMQQIKALAAVIEQNQQELKSSIEALQESCW